MVSKTHSLRSDALCSEPQEPPGSTLEGVLLRGEEPTTEFLEEWSALEQAPELDEDDLAWQALTAPGDDGDPTTPE